MDWNHYPRITGLSSASQKLVDEQLKLAFMQGLSDAMRITGEQAVDNAKRPLWKRDGPGRVLELVGMRLVRRTRAISEQDRPK